MMSDRKERTCKICGKAVNEFHTCVVPKSEPQAETVAVSLARIDELRKAEKERDTEKEHRIRYQDLAYRIADILDAAFGVSVARGEGCTVDILDAEVWRLVSERDELKQEVERLKEIPSQLETLAIKQRDAAEQILAALVGKLEAWIGEPSGGPTDLYNKNKIKAILANHKQPETPGEAKEI